MIVVAVIVLACSTIAQANNYLYYSAFSVLSTSTYQCFKQTGYPKIGIRVSSFPEGFQERQLQKVFNAYNAGIEPELIIQPCRARSAALEVSMMMDAFGDMVNKFWLFPHVDYNVQQCQWKNQTDNCQFLQSIISQLKKHNKQIGIYSTRPSWKYIFNGQENCQEVSSLPLFWEPDGDSQDGQPNFNSFSKDKFGGWIVPAMKRYTRYIICGASIQYTYYP